MLQQALLSSLVEISIREQRVFLAQTKGCTTAPPHGECSAADIALTPSTKGLIGYNTKRHTLIHVLEWCALILAVARSMDELPIRLGMTEA